VWFYDVDADGMSLDDKRTALLPPEKLGPVPKVALTAEEHAKNNLPDILARWRTLHLLPRPLGEGRGEDNGKQLATLAAEDAANYGGEFARKRSEQSFLVPKADLVAHGYDLSLNRYKEVVHEEVAQRPLSEILASLGKLEVEIQQRMKEIEGMLK
jgi:type I restriction enzyme M protein